jgi:hypothetical protein
MKGVRRGEIQVFIAVGIAELELRFRAWYQGRVGGGCQGGVDGKWFKVGGERAR